MSSCNIFNKYPAHSDFGGRKVLNIGCGFMQYRLPNVVNVDAFDICKPNVVWDLNKTPYPFEGEYFDLILANHIMEHLPNWWGAMNECARLLKPNGRLEVWVPGAGSDAVHGFRDHVVEINHCGFYGTFGTYREGGNAWAVENTEGQANRLKFLRQNTHMNGNWWIKYAPDSLKKWMALHLRNVVVEDGYVFTKVTEGEYRDEMRRFHERTRRNQAVSVPQVR